MFLELHCFLSPTPCALATLAFFTFPQYAMPLPASPTPLCPKHSSPSPPPFLFLSSCSSDLSLNIISLGQSIGYIELKIKNIHIIYKLCTTYPLYQPNIIINFCMHMYHTFLFFCFGLVVEHSPAHHRGTPVVTKLIGYIGFSPFPVLVPCSFTGFSGIISKTPPYNQILISESILWETQTMTVMECMLYPLFYLHT